MRNHYNRQDELKVKKSLAVSAFKGLFLLSGTTIATISFFGEKLDILDNLVKFVGFFS